MTDQKQMCGRLMAVGIPKAVATQVIAQVEQWALCSGEEWTVEHLKEIKQIFLHKLAGEPYRPTHWIKMRSGLPKGPIRALFKLKGRTLGAILTGLNGYTCFVSQLATRKQKDKFFSSMTSPDTKGLKTTLKIVPFKCINPAYRPPTLVEYCQTSSRGPGSAGRTYPEVNHKEMLLHSLSSNPVRNLILEHAMLFNKVIPVDMLHTVRPAESGRIDYHSFGSITGIQEPGFKLRAVANPDRVVQAVLEPLKWQLGDILKRYVPNDCTFDQTRGLSEIQRWLQAGDTVYSVDLSDATNLFPWNLQKDLLLKSLHESYHEMIEIMDEVSRGPWHTRIRGELEEVRFTRGQPLGLGPSFFSFAFAHNSLLEGLCIKHRRPRRYFILGDDVVIGDSELHRLYMATMQNLGCKISVSKSFSSSSLAEFAGFTITKDEISRSFKWRMTSDYSFMEALKYFGKRGLALCTPSQRAVARLIGPIPRPLGGLGWSDGKTLSEFFETPLAQALSLGLSSEREVPLVFRDLNADLKSLIHEVNGFVGDGRIPDGFGNSLAAMLTGYDIEYSYSKVSDLMDVPHIIEDEWRPVQAKFLHNVGISHPSYLRDGYYPILPRTRDPRPSVLPVLIQLGSQIGGLPASERKKIERFISQFTRKSKIKATSSIIKSPQAEPKGKVVEAGSPQMVRETRTRRSRGYRM